MCKVTKIEMAGGDYPRCCHKVTDAIQVQRVRCKERHKNHPESSNYARHMERHPTRCHRAGMYLVDGLPMCSGHAGKYLLKIALK